ncbi:transglycosylase SLT domain-containing protein [Luteimonas sp. Y-2-2-4F]|nr:lytic transglycosylase domain-containing protein [Luteimonas sp. Y-2-2-4F]MCD9031552.1 transglycosylase SLT domain-containing protein [Luteimonas sp. Y-2-2-4F]
MLPGMELMGCAELAVPQEVMRHVVRVESSFNPYAIGVVGGRLARQPRNLPEALSTVRMLEREGYNFSLGLAQVNRHNLEKYGLSYETAFQACPNLQAGARILAECHGRAGGDWGKAFSCYYSGNFTTGFRHGYVQKVFASYRQEFDGQVAAAIPVVGREANSAPAPRRTASLEASLLARRLRGDPPEAPAMQAAVLSDASPQPALAAAAPAPPVAGAQSVPPPSAAPQRMASVAASSSVPAMASDQPVTVQAIGGVAEPAMAAGPAQPALPLPARDSAFVF